MGNAASDMTDVVLDTVSWGIRGLLGIFSKKPNETNDTMQAIQANNEHLEQERQRLQAREEELREREASARQHEQDAQRIFEDAIQAREEAAISAAKQSQESARQREEAALMKAKQIEAAARMREEAATAAAKEREEAALRKAKQTEEAARMREEAATAAAKKRVQAARLAAKHTEEAARVREEAALAEAAKAKDALLKGIRPVVMPTPEQVAAARERMQLHTEKLHFAVCGSSGSGKSTIINAVRGLGSKGEGAARVGVTECTSEVSRYPDPRNELPYSRFIWYDVPGAGTTAVPDWQYFNDQGLFVFDFIIMVYDIRFTKIDVGIIENCLRFNIPVFIVRSKADQHIQNMIKDETDCEPGDTEYYQVYKDMTESYVSATRKDFSKHMENMADNKDIDQRDQQLIYNLRVYIVSAATLRGLLQTKSSVKKEKVIHETELIEDMLRAAARRRYSNTPGETINNLFKKGKEALSGVSAGLLSLSLNIGTEKTKKNSDPKRVGVVDPRSNEIEDPNSSGSESKTIKE